MKYIFALVALVVLSGCDNKGGSGGGTAAPVTQQYGYVMVNGQNVCYNTTTNTPAPTPQYCQYNNNGGYPNYPGYPGYPNQGGYPYQQTQSQVCYGWMTVYSSNGWGYYPRFCNGSDCSGRVAMNQWGQQVYCQ